MQAVLEAVQSTAASPSHGMKINWWIVVESLWYVGIALVFFIVFYLCLTKIPRLPALMVATTASILMYFIIHTSIFGAIDPFYNGWFGRPMWFSGLLMAFFLFFWAAMAVKKIQKQNFTKTDELMMMMMIPVCLMSGASSFFSGLKALTVLYTSIPAVACLSYFFLLPQRQAKHPLIFNLFILVIFLAPFYYTTAWADWRFTFFDVIPQQADTEIPDGFGKGIKTNRVYARLHDWIQKTSAAYTHEDDFMISYALSSMTYMIAKRRPALTTSYNCLSEIPPEFYQKAIQVMKEKGRKPAIAYVFEGMPVLFTVSLEEGTYQWGGKQFHFETATDPLTQYIKEHMVLADQFVISQNANNRVRCFVDPATAKRK